MISLNVIQALADELCAEKDPRYKDQWELGFDAGQNDAGSRLKKLLEG